MSPNVSVVMAVHNGERYLKESLRGILEQRGVDFEAVIIDDGSTDATAQVLEGARRADGRLHVIYQARQGLTMSLNTGIRLARGRYIARHDADDVSLPDRFERQVRYLDDHRKVVAVSNAADIMDCAGATIGRLDVCQGARAIRRGLMGCRTTLLHSSSMIRREALEAIGGYREAFQFSQDTDLWLRLSERFELENLPEVLFRWRLSPQGVYATRRRVQLRYGGVALAFAQERRRFGGDSYELFRQCGGDLEWFASCYRLRGVLESLWGELLFRALSDPGVARSHLGRALLSGSWKPRTIGLFGWSLLGFGWPGRRPVG